MSLSGYDSESLGFESINRDQTAQKHGSTQTTDYEESSAASQTVEASDFACMAQFLDNETPITQTTDYASLNDFLRRVVPSMMDQLDQNDHQVLYNTSDSDEEEMVPAKLFQQINTKDSGTGDAQSNGEVLSVSWSSGGNSLAVSLGRSYHETWCEHEGLIRVYTAKRSEGDKYVHAFDITEKNCINVVLYHYKVAALLAYGTNSGDVVICNLQNSSGSFDTGSAMSASHESRITCLKWADTNFTNVFLMMHVLGSKKRRLASDQVLVSASTDAINVWQVNTNAKVFQNIVTYKVGASDVTCFDFIKTSPLRPSEDQETKDFFAVGTVCGKLYLCNAKKTTDSGQVDPVCEVLEGHSTCVLDVEFSSTKAGIFASISMDAELRVYDVRQLAPVKVICLEDPISSMGWIPTSSCLVLGLTKPDKDAQRVKLYNTASGRPVAVGGLADQREDAVTALAVHQGGSCRLAAGGSSGIAQIWDLPIRRLRYSFEDYEF